MLETGGEYNKFMGDDNFVQLRRSGFSLCCPIIANVELSSPEDVSYVRKIFQMLGDRVHLLTPDQYKIDGKHPFEFFEYTTLPKPSS